LKGPNLLLYFPKENNYWEVYIFFFFAIRPGQEFVRRKTGKKGNTEEQRSLLLQAEWVPAGCSGSQRGVIRLFQLSACDGALVFSSISVILFMIFLADVPFLQISGFVR